MIIGTGTDIVKISRIEKLYNKFGDKFLKRIFTPDELERCRKRRRIFNCLALRFAAKEALLKSIRTGLRDNLKFNQIEVLNDRLGAPYLKLYGSVKEYIEKLNVKATHLSLSDDGDYAVANVFLEV